MQVMIDQLRRSYQSLPWPTAAGMLALGTLVSALMFARLWLVPLAGGPALGVDDDFPSFHTAAQAALAPETVATLYDPAAFQARLDNARQNLWLYPPTSFLLLAPLGLLPEPVARACWIALSLLAAWVAARAIAPGNRLLQGMLVVSPGVFLALYLGQAGALFAGLMVSALIAAPRRPVLAGVLIAVLAVKPQYGLLIPLFLIATAQWRVLAIASLGVLVIAGLSLAVYGLAPWLALLEAAGTIHGAHAFGLSHIGQLSPSQVARFVGFGPGVAGMVQLLALCLGGLAVMAACRTGADYRLKTALLLLVTATVSPYIWIYDMVLWQAGICLVLVASPRLSRLAQYGLGLAFLAPLLFFFMLNVPAYLVFSAIKPLVAGYVLWRIYTPQAQQGAEGRSIMAMAGQ